ncbi:hypothetical protein CDAR_230481 [Caerostris darwini]|uniref:Uncharacterized protein n=1 Tax=Caerostris darwini TaxID=1538125 RepID=A0AAV4RV53_9ARAC|nr:hypothetical protein CDAR_230481 [Caerostris darwini]
MTLVIGYSEYMVIPSSADVKGGNFLEQQPRGDHVYHCKPYLTSLVVPFHPLKGSTQGKTMVRGTVPQPILRG